MAQHELQAQNKECDSQVQVNAKIIKAQAQAKKLIVCTRPEGRFNECLWQRIEGGTCIRRRCNASGQWSDEREVPYATCTTKQKIAVCTE